MPAPISLHESRDIASVFIICRPRPHVLPGYVQSGSEYADDEQRSSFKLRFIFSFPIVVSDRPFLGCLLKYMVEICGTRSKVSEGMEKLFVTQLLREKYRNLY